MQRYDFNCKTCNSNFFLKLDINANKENIPCSNCGSRDTFRLFNAAIIKKKKDFGIEEEENPQKTGHDNHESHHHLHDQCSPEEDYL